MQQIVKAAQESGRAEVVAALCDLLKQGDEADRCFACRALGAISAAEAIPALVERLRDEDVDVCVDAAGALGALGSQAALAPLEESLRNDPDGEVKIAVVESLARVADPQTFPVLMEIAERRPAEMIFDESADWDPWWDMQRAAVLALGRARVAEAAPVLARLLDDEDGQDIDSEIVAMLAQLGDAGEQILFKRLSHPRELVRRRAAAALGRASSPASLEKLSRTLKDDSPQVRIAALEALEKRAGRRYLPVIIGLYRDLDAEVRQAAIRVATRLAEAGGVEAPDLQALLPLLGDKDPRVRAMALSGMDRGQLPEALVERICGALADPEPKVAAVACALLGRHGSAEQFQGVLRIARDPAVAPELRRAALRAIGARGAWTEEIVALVANVLSEQKSPARLAAMDALLDLHRAGAHTPQKASATTGQREAREPAEIPEPMDLIIAALRGEVVSRAVPEDLPNRASNTAEDATAVRSLELPVEVASPAAPGDAPGPASKASADAAAVRNQALPVEATPASPEPRMAKSSLEAIAMDNVEVALAQSESENSGAEIQPALDEETKEFLALTEANEATARWLFQRDSIEADLDVRRLAARTLGSADSEAAVFALTESLACADQELRREAAASLASVADRSLDNGALAVAADALLESADASDRDLRVACVKALAKVHDPRAGARLLAALDDKEPAVRIEALRGLGAVAQQDEVAIKEHGLDSFEACLSRVSAGLADPEPGVRIATARALADMLRCRDSESRQVSDAVASLAHAGFGGTGEQSREMGRALRRIAPAVATGHLLEKLRTLATSAERRVAIEMLEEIHRDADEQAVSGA